MIPKDHNVSVTHSLGHGITSKGAGGLGLIFVSSVVMIVNQLAMSHYTENLFWRFGANVHMKILNYYPRNGVKIWMRVDTRDIEFNSNV